MKEEFTISEIGRAFVLYHRNKLDKDQLLAVTGWGIDKIDATLAMLDAGMWDTLVEFFDSKAPIVLQ